jgi:hypothetical protein
MILDFSNKWPLGNVLRVKFFNGNEQLQNKVFDVAQIWQQYANIKFEKVGVQDEAEIRVKFGGEENISKIGSDCLGGDTSLPTMTFLGLGSGSSNEDIHKYALHEFGHSIGFIHEHINPVFNINWNKEKVIEYYKQFNFSEHDCELNVFRKCVPSSVLYSEFDPKSIMTYPIPAELNDEGIQTDMNSELSDIDKKMAAIYYPKSEAEIITLMSGPEFVQGSVNNSYQPISYKFNFETSGSKLYVESESDNDISIGVYSIENEGLKKGCINYIIPIEEYQGGCGQSAKLETYLPSVGEYFLKVNTKNPIEKSNFKMKVYLI